MQKKIENPLTTPIKPDEQKFKIRVAVENFYDIQKLRIQCGNRICAAFKMGADVEEETSALKSILNEYERITDVYVEKFGSKPRSLGKAVDSMSDTAYIKSVFDYSLVSQYRALLDQENESNQMLTKIVKDHPMWDLFFKDAKGCGPVIAGICLAYFDVHKAPYVSNFWSYAGLGTRVDQETGERVAMSRYATIDQEYVDKDGNTKTRKSIGYNDFLHTKLLGVLGDSFIKSGGKYRQVYDDKKNYFVCRGDMLRKDGSVNQIRCHRAAIRQAVKIFLLDMWVAWRSYEGYTLTPTYAEAHLGLAPHGYNEADGRQKLDL